MKIIGIESIIIAMPLSERGEASASPSSLAPTPPMPRLTALLVRVDTDEGLSGWGEALGQGAARATKAIVDDLITPIVVGSDPREIDAIGKAVRFRTLAFGLAGLVLNAASALDVALWDLAAKRNGVPLYRLLGRDPVNAIAACASVSPCGDPDLLTKLVLDAVGSGYRQVKIHERRPDEIHAARAALGDGVALTLDVNCRWSLEEALGLVEDLEPANLLWVEDPVWAPDDEQALRKLHDVGMRVAAAENTGSWLDYRRLFAAGAVDIAAPDVTKVGGVSEMLRVIDLANAWAVPVYPHSASFGPGRQATLHVLAARAPTSSIQQLYVAPEALLLPNYADPVDGFIPVPQEIGLGGEPNADVIARYRIDRPS